MVSHRDTHCTAVAIATVSHPLSVGRPGSRSAVRLAATVTVTVSRSLDHPEVPVPVAAGASVILLPYTGSSMKSLSACVECSCTPAETPESQLLYSVTTDCTVTALLPLQTCSAELNANLL